jgi:hypothetical protein
LFANAESIFSPARKSLKCMVSSGKEGSPLFFLGPKTINDLFKIMVAQAETLEHDLKLTMVETGTPLLRDDLS